MTLLERVLAADSDLIAHFGIEVVSVDGEAATLRGHPTPALVNSAGLVHGSYGFALLDTAAAYALAARDIHGVTIGSHLTFSRPISAGADILATVAVRTAGRTLANLRGTLTADGKTAMLATLQFAVVEQRV
jgi:uncharacterized protein (TIGR00369 family)